MAIEIPRYTGPVGLPEDGHVIVISNSEREDMACPTRWWFRQVEALKTPDTEAKRFGTLWHAVLEEMNRWWLETDSRWPTSGAEVCPFCARASRPVEDGMLPLGRCPRCDGTGRGVLARIRDELAEVARASENRPDGARFTREDADEMVDRLGRTWEGWLHRHGPDPYRSMRVVGVEVEIGRVILNPRTGHPYCPETYLVRLRDGTMRLAGTAEVSEPARLPEGAEVVMVRWPWYQVGRLDSVLAHRDTGALYVGEWKSSSDPRGLVADLSVDPQTSGYVWLLDQPEIRARFGGGSVVGFLYDVTSSAYLADPEPLKGRPTKAEPNPPLTFSQARNRTTPSWRYRATLAAAGVDPAPYAEHLLYLASQVDPKLHVREPGSVGAESRERYADEVFAIASRIAAARRAVARASDLTDLSIAVPRVPICRLPGGGCAFRAPCLLDGDEVRRKFEIAPQLSWKA
jgi:hypothetical protein